MSFLDSIKNIFSGGSSSESSNSGSGGSYTQGYDIVQYPTYPWAATNQKYLSDYYGGELERIRKGQNPEWWANAQPQIREGMSRGNYQATYGRPGERTGTMQTATEAGALTGLGARSTMAQTSKAAKDYAERERAIDEYLAGQGVGINQAGAQFAAQGLQNLPRGPETQLQPVGQMTQANSSGQLANTGMSMLGGLDWGSIIGGLLGKKATNTDYTAGIQPYTNLGSLTSLFNSTGGGGTGGLNWAQIGNTTSSGSGLTNLFNNTYSGYGF